MTYQDSHLLAGSTPPYVIGHRGNPSVYPENTLDSIKSAIDLEIDGVEFDVTLTADNIPIVFHQESFKLDKASMALKRTSCNDASCWTLNLSYSEIKKIDAGSWFDHSFSSKKIPPLKDLLSLNWKNAHPFIELKDPFYWRHKENRDWFEIFAASLKPFFEKLLARNMTFFVLSFSIPLLKHLRNIWPDIKIIPLLWNTGLYSFTERNALKEIIGLSPSGIGIYELHAIDALAILKDALQGKNINTIVYESEYIPSNPSNIEKRKEIWQKLLSMGAKAMITNHPAELKAFISNSTLRS
ncbi:MAG: hypothetical protein D6808_06065 [Candidatus Dadabacteria bacterium]|nr:MAG: hypothetical protein D6808_06065 [Candidatus Dadabacteria bacterium]